MEHCKFMSGRHLVFVCAALAVLVGCGDDGDGERRTPTASPNPTATPSSDDVELSRISRSARVSDQRRARGHYARRVLVGAERRHGRTLADEAAEGLRFSCGGAECGVGAVRNYALAAPSAGAQALTLDVDTDAGVGRVELTWRTQRTLEVRFAPPQGALGGSAPAVLGDAYALADGERIYGLTERLTDSPPISRQRRGLPPYRRDPSA